jgi:hypothetical protein
VAGRALLPATQLLVFRFGPGADFEGRLVGALERIESGGSLRVLDALFVASDAETGEVSAVDLKGDAGGLVAPLVEFRLDPAARRRSTERALESREGGDDAQVVRQLAEGLEPGAAIAALLVEHRWARALDDAVSRTGGSPLASDFVEAATLADLSQALLAAVQSAAQVDD